MGHQVLPPQLSLALSDELKSKGVRVLCVCPGPTATNFFKAAGFDESPISVGTTSEKVVDESLSAFFKDKWIATTGFWNKGRRRDLLKTA